MTDEERMFSRKSVERLQTANANLRAANERLREEVKDLTASGELLVASGRELYGKVQFLVDHLYMEDLLSDGTFTFPDGDTWWATGVAPEEEEE